MELKRVSEGDAPTYDELVRQYVIAHRIVATSIIHQIADERSAVNDYDRRRFLTTIATEGNVWDDNFDDEDLVEPIMVLRQTAQRTFIRAIIKPLRGDDVEDKEESFLAPIIQYLSQHPAHHGHNKHDQGIVETFLENICAHRPYKPLPGGEKTYLRTCLLNGLYGMCRPELPEHFAVLIDHIRRNVVRVNLVQERYGIGVGMLPKPDIKTFELIEFLHYRGHQELAMLLARCMKHSHERLLSA